MRGTLFFLACFFSAAAFSQTGPPSEKPLAGLFPSCYVRYHPVPAVKPAAVLKMGCGTVPNKRTPVIQLRCGVSTQKEIPLYIVDGQVVDKLNMDSFKPGVIERIEILRGAAAVDLYGSRGVDGVVYITTKQISNCSLLFLDATDSLPVSAASVDLWTTERMWLTLSSKVGKAKVDGLWHGEDLGFAVSCVGYQGAQSTVRFDSSGQEKTFYLRRAVKQMDEVIVKSYGTSVYRTFLSCCGKMSKCSLLKDGIIKDSSIRKKMPVELWPNPVRAGQIINLQIAEDVDGIYQIYSPAGQLLQAARVAAYKGQTIKIPTANWPNGTYFLRVQANDSRQTSTHKFILQ